MLAYILAIAVGIGSFALYMAAFLFPEVHRKDDFLWSGVGLFYALVLWVSAGRITGGVLLGQIAGVSLLGWFVIETLKLRRAYAHPELQTEIENFSLIDWLQNSFAQFTSRFRKQKPQPEVVKTDAVVDSPIETTTPISATVTETEKAPVKQETESVTEAETQTEAEKAPVKQETPKEETKTKKKPLQKLFGGITSRFRQQKPTKTPETTTKVETPEAETSPPSSVEELPTVKVSEKSSENTSATSSAATEATEPEKGIQDQDTLIIFAEKSSASATSPAATEATEQEKSNQNQDPFIQLPKTSEELGTSPGETGEFEQEKNLEDDETFIQLPKTTSEELATFPAIDPEIGDQTIVQDDTLIQISETSSENTSENTYSSLEEIAGSQATDTSDKEEVVVEEEPVVETKASTRNIKVSTQLAQELIEGEDLPETLGGENLSSSIEEILEEETTSADESKIDTSSQTKKEQTLTSEKEEAQTKNKLSES